jgi:signal transduction histidine kinase
VDNGVYGTFCFYDTAPRDGVEDWEVTVVDLMARWVSAEIERERRADRLERQNERLDRFASFVSHDLRTPLSVLRGRLDLAEETGDPGEFAACREAVNRMDATIDDLLTLARAGEVDRRPVVDLAAAAERAWERAGEPTATLRLETERTLQADAGLLGQLLENLSFFKPRNPPFRAGVKPTTASRSTAGCRPNTPRQQTIIRVGCIEISTAK